MSSSIQGQLRSYLIYNSTSNGKLTQLSENLHQEHCRTSNLTSISQAPNETMRSDSVNSIYQDRLHHSDHPQSPGTGIPIISVPLTMTITSQDGLYLDMYLDDVLNSIPSRCIKDIKHVDVANAIARAYPSIVEQYDLSQMMLDCPSDSLFHQETSTQQNDRIAKLIAISYRSANSTVVLSIRRRSQIMVNRFA